MRKIKKITVELDERIIIKHTTDNRIVFSDGSYIDFDHSQDCCERNFADFSSIKDSVLEDTVFKSISLETNENGFLLNGHLINCYSYQNGYYSSDLDVFYRDECGVALIYLNTSCDVQDY